MKIVSTYDIRIKEHRHIFDDTISVYREAVDFLIGVCDERWDEISLVSGDKSKQRFVEKLVHSTKDNAAVYGFDAKFNKFPSYLRRAAISCAVGKVSSWKSNLSNWKTDPVGKRPRKPIAGNTFPVLYRGECYKFVSGNVYACEVKVHIRNTWDWITVQLRKSDVDYIEKHCASRKMLSPSLVKHGKRWSLAFPFEERSDLAMSVNSVLAVDLGINNACVCSVMTPEGTVLGRHFLRLSKEQDSLMHALNRIKKAQQHGCYKTPRLWAKAKGINADIASKTAQFIVDIAAYYNVDVIVFEALDLNKKKRGSKKQKLHMWKACNVQRIVADKAHRLHMRISRVCAWGTSKLAYDGSGIVERDDENYSMCTFQTGKRYHADLSASYNIGARYFIREITKSLPETVRLECEAKVPCITKRSTCTYATLLNLNTELEKLAS